MKGLYVETLVGVELKNPVGSWERLREAFELGKTVERAAFLLGCSIPTLARRVKDDPSIREGIIVDTNQGKFNREQVRAAFEQGKTLQMTAALLNCSMNALYKYVVKDPTIRDGLPKDPRGRPKGSIKAL